MLVDGDHDDESHLKWLERHCNVKTCMINCVSECPRELQIKDVKHTLTCTVYDFKCYNSTICPIQQRVFKIGKRERGICWGTQMNLRVYHILKKIQVAAEGMFA